MLTDSFKEAYARAFEKRRKMDVDRYVKQLVEHGIPVSLETRLPFRKIALYACNPFVAYRIIITALHYRPAYWKNNLGAIEDARLQLFVAMSAVLHEALIYGGCPPKVHPMPGLPLGVIVRYDAERTEPYLAAEERDWLPVPVKLEAKQAPVFWPPEACSRGPP